MTSPEPGARETAARGSPFLFSEIPLRGVLEELESVYRRRRDIARTLGDEDAGALEESYRRARSCLEAVLSEASVVEGAPPGEGRAAVESEEGAAGASDRPRSTGSSASGQGRGSPGPPLPEAPDGSA